MATTGLETFTCYHQERTMTTAVQPTTQSHVSAAFARAFDRAVANKTVVYKIDGATFVAPSASGGTDHTVRVTGSHGSAIACDCPAGRAGYVCHAMAATTFGRKYGVYAVRPVIAPSTLEEVALSERISREIKAEMARASYDLSHGSPEARLGGADAAIRADAAYRIAEYDARQYAASFRSPGAPAIY